MQIMKIALVVLVLAAGTAIAVPVDIRLDLSNYAPSPVRNWNTYSAQVTDTPVIDFTTGSTSHGVTLTLSTNHATYTWSRGTSSTNWNTANPLPSWVDASGNAVKDFFNLGWNLAGYITFKNLDPSLKYTIEVVSSIDGGAANVPFYVNGANLKTFNHKTQGYDLGQWMTWTDISPDASNQIRIQAAPTSATQLRHLRQRGPHLRGARAGHARAAGPGRPAGRPSPPCLSRPIFARTIKGSPPAETATLFISAIPTV